MGYACNKGGSGLSNTTAWHNRCLTVPMHVKLSPHSIAGDATTSAVWQYQLQLLLDSTGEGVFGIDLDGQCVFINRAGANMLGWEATAVLGRNMHQLTHHSHEDGTHYPDAECPIFNAFRQGLACRIESEVFWRKDHTSFAVEYSSHPIVDDGSVLGAVITFVDITARRQAAQALQHANAKLARANDELELRVGERTNALSSALGQVRQLAAYSETIREDERTRIAREVHYEPRAISWCVRP
jgi:PAS domain S-box-containing protein